MKNIQYITDNYGNRKSVVILLKDYEEMLEDHSSKIFEEYLVQQLVLSLLDISFEHLKVPMNHKNLNEDATLLLKCLAEKAKTNYGFAENYEVTLMDKEVFQDLDEEELNDKTVQTQRNKNLFPKIKKKQLKAVIYRLHQYPPTGRKKGSVYRLNFLESINKAVKEFLNLSTVNSKHLPLLIEDAKRTKLCLIEKSNTVFKTLVNILIKYLDNLPEDYINNKSPQTQGSTDHQNLRHGNFNGLDKEQ